MFSPEWQKAKHNRRNHEKHSYLAIKDTQLRRVVSDILIEMGPVAAPPLREILKDENLVRSQTTGLLNVLSEIKDEKSSATFLAFIENEDPQLRTLAMKGLITLNHPDIPGLLLSATQDESQSVRKYSALALKGSNDSSALEALTDLLGDEHFSVRFAAFEGLQKKEDRAKPYLIKNISEYNGSPVYAYDLMEDLLKKWGQK